MTFSALADGDEREVEDGSALVRNVETRAFKRAIARALGISNVDLNNKNDGITPEEEVETPLNDESIMNSARARREKFNEISEKNRSGLTPGLKTTSAQNSYKPDDDDF